jgi:hypothetical protein
MYGTEISGQVRRSATVLQSHLYRRSVAEIEIYEKASQWNQSLETAR